MNHINTREEVLEAFRVFDKDGMVNRHFFSVFLNYIWLIFLCAWNRPRLRYHRRAQTSFERIGWIYGP